MLALLAATLVTLGAFGLTVVGGYAPPERAIGPVVVLLVVFVLAILWLAVIRQVHRRRGRLMHLKPRASMITLLAGWSALFLASLVLYSVYRRDLTTEYPNDPSAGRILIGWDMHPPARRLWKRLQRENPGATPGLLISESGGPKKIPEIWTRESVRVAALCLGISFIALMVTLVNLILTVLFFASARQSRLDPFAWRLRVQARPQPVESSPTPGPTGIGSSTTPRRGTGPGVAKQVFISYAREDNASEDANSRWLDRVRTHLKPKARQQDLVFWSDEKIRAGDDWNAEIQRKLREARVAILLLSSDYLASDYIFNDELPILFAKRKQQSLVVLPVYLSHADYGDIVVRFPGPGGEDEEVALSSVQGINDPREPLADLEHPQQEAVLARLARRVAEICTPDLPESEAEASDAHEGQGHP